MCDKSSCNRVSADIDADVNVDENVDVHVGMNVDVDVDIEAEKNSNKDNSTFSYKEKDGNINANSESECGSGSGSGNVSGNGNGTKVFSGNNKDSIVGKMNSKEKPKNKVIEKNSDKEKIIEFENYMRSKNLLENTIQYNIKVVKLLSIEVLAIFEEGLESIDTYSFEEFTDMIVLINEQLGGRPGIKKMLDAMLLLTEFLKEKRYIKGGKIAYYKRMFSKTEYYFEKYDMMTGKKDDTKSFIKKITSGSLYSDTIKIIENINVYDLDTIIKIDKLINDVPFDKSGMDSITLLIRSMLVDLNLMEYKNGRIITSKKGRAFSRLPVEERYASLIYMIFQCCDWKNAARINESEDSNLDFNNYISTITTIYNKSNEVVLNMDNIAEKNDDNLILEIASDRFRIARIEAMTCGMILMDICFIGMGLIEFSTTRNGEIIYKITSLGKSIIKLLYSSVAWQIKFKIDIIANNIKNKRFDEAEAEIIDFLSIYGSNLVVWNYYGQLLILRKQYKYAYTVLKYAYENSSKRGKNAKTVLYYLVMCCRKLKLNDDIKNYENKLQTIEKN